MSFYGKAVQYTENGKDEIDAMVVQEHGLFPEAQGSAGQPLVHLVFADPAKESLNLADMHAKLILRLDVAHASQWHSEDWIASHPGQSAEWSGGRWSEMGTSPLAILDATRKAAEAKAKAKADAAKAAQAGSAEAAAETDTLDKKLELLRKKKEVQDLEAALAPAQPKETVQ